MIEGAAPPAVAASRMLPRIDGFEVLTPLGTGAMSTVYRAREEATGRLVALKVLHPHIAFSATSVERFLHEVRAYERLGHPNVISCLRGGRSGEHWFVALEHLEGGDLRALLRTAGRLPPEAAAFVLHQVLSALAHAHGCGVVHRDVKPENVMIGADGTMKLADFGISKALDFTRLTEEGTLLGTPAYMAPEQIATGNGDARSDLWSAGVLLYELVTGGNPFAADSAGATTSRVATLSPPPLSYRASDVPERLDDVLSRLLVRDPAGRAARAEDVLEDLERLLAASGPLATREGLRELVADPAATGRRWATQHAAVHLATARQAAAGGESRLAIACLEACEAAILDPESSEAARLATELSARTGGRAQAAPSARALALEREAEQSPTSLLAIVNLVRVARSEGDLVTAARAWRWGRRRSPRDRFAAMQLATALGFELAAHLEGTDPERLRQRLKGGAAWPAGAAARGDFTLVLRPPVWIAGLALLVALPLISRFAAGGGGARAARRAAPVVESALPDAGQVYLEKAAAVDDAGDAERALALYDRFLRENLGDARRAEALFRSGRALEELARFDEAKARYRTLLADAPEAEVAVRARRRLAGLLDASGEVDEALATLAPVATSGELEDRAMVRLAQARLLEKRGDLAGALAIYDGLLALRFDAALAARARLGRGRVLLRRGDPSALADIAAAEAQAGPRTLVAREAADLRLRAPTAAAPR